MLVSDVGCWDLDGLRCGNLPEVSVDALKALGYFTVDFNGIRLLWLAAFIQWPLGKERSNLKAQ